MKPKPILLSQLRSEGYFYCFLNQHPRLFSLILEKEKRRGREREIAISCPAQPPPQAPYQDEPQPFGLLGGHSNHWATRPGPENILKMTADRRAFGYTDPHVLLLLGWNWYNCLVGKKHKNFPSVCTRNSKNWSCRQNPTRTPKMLICTCHSGGRARGIGTACLLPEPRVNTSVPVSPQPPTQAPRTQALGVPLQCGSPAISGGGPHSAPWQHAGRGRIRR